MSDSLQPPPKYVVFQRVDRFGHGQALENSIRINGVLYRMKEPAMDDKWEGEDLEVLAERVRVLEAAMTVLMEVVRDVISDGKDSVNPGLMALAKKALRQAEEAQET